MEMDFDIPEQLPVMSLDDVVLFPKAILPLYIFEERYRRMLTDVLAGDRLFIVARRNRASERPGADEPVPESVATVGVVRASHKNGDGTSNLVLQGVARVSIDGFVRHTPYPVVRVTPLPEAADAGSVRIRERQQQLRELLRANEFLTDEIPAEFTEFLLSIDAPETFLDLTAYAVCGCAKVKQNILRCETALGRYDCLLGYLDRKIRERAMFERLQGQTRDEEIGRN